jgi:hypothetical protein
MVLFLAVQKMNYQQRLGRVVSAELIGGAITSE